VTVTPAPSDVAADGAVPEQSGRRRRIGEVLVEQGLLTQEQLKTALAEQRRTATGQTRQRLGALVTDLGLATEKEVATALAEALALPLVDLGRTLAQPEAVRLLPRPVAERAGVLVLSHDNGKITVATADPTNVVALDDVKLYTGATELVVLVAPESQVRDHLARSWSLSEDSSDVSTLFEGIDSDDDEPEDISARPSRPLRSSGWSTWCSPTPSAPAPPTCTSSRRPASCASGTASTACCATS
jgi:type IV pilus assembly protein PilB